MSPMENLYQGVPSPSQLWYTSLYPINRCFKWSLPLLLMSSSVGKRSMSAPADQGTVLIADGVGCSVNIIAG